MSPKGSRAIEYLGSQGVPENEIKVEVDGTNSYEELSASALIVANSGTSNEVLIVTDPYHSFRVAAVRRTRSGSNASVSPADVHGSVRSSLGRETVAASHRPGARLPPAQQPALRAEIPVRGPHRPRSKVTAHPSGVV